MINAVEIDDRISKCQKILDVDPNSQIFAALAEAYRKKGEFEAAFRVCQNGLRIHPNYGSAHVVMAKINLDRGLYDWAEIEAKKAADIDGRTRTIELLLAEIYIYKGEFHEAIKLLRKLNEADPNNDQIKKLLDIAQKIPEEQTALAGKDKVDDEKESDSTDGVQVADESASKSILGTRDVIERAMKTGGVEGALLVNFEGLVIDAEWNLATDPSLCSATLGDVSNVLSQDLVRSSFGNFQTVLIEAGNATFYLVRVHNGLFLFVVNESANLGTLRMKVENLLDNYQ
ncbi:MAG: roadblock/LC7 domain-containing protein [Candidatus Zixiibacteriota bacterium]|nr:MAG: roadblock/LC7 domain-containing protein [candidate division Zixibacteria bacterium]